MRTSRNEDIEETIDLTAHYIGLRLMIVSEEGNPHGTNKGEIAKWKRDLERTKQELASRGLAKWI